MLTIITILETSGIFIVGLAARAVLILAVFAALALPIAAVSWVLHAAAERWNAIVGHPGHEAHAHR
jgi:hypothetical protein